MLRHLRRSSSSPPPTRTQRPSFYNLKGRIANSPESLELAATEDSDSGGGYSNYWTRFGRWSSDNMTSSYDDYSGDDGWNSTMGRYRSNWSEDENDRVGEGSSSQGQQTCHMLEPHQIKAVGEAIDDATGATEDSKDERRGFRAFADFLNRKFVVRGAVDEPILDDVEGRKGIDRGSMNLSVGTGEALAGGMDSEDVEKKGNNLRKREKVKAYFMRKFVTSESGQVKGI